MKAFLRFALVVVLSGCGGGSIEITNQNADGSITARPAKTVIELLESTSDAELGQKVQSLHGKFGDNLEWSDFWTRLSASPVKQRIFPAHRDAMLTLQSRSCDEKGFAAYVAFIVGLGDGFEYIMGGNRVCPTQLSAAQTMSFLRVFHQADANRRTRADSAALTVAALNEQLSHEPGAGWDTLLTNEDASWIRPALQTVVNGPTPAASLEFAHKFMNATGGLAYPDVFGPKLFNDVTFLDQVLAAHGRAATLQLLSSVMSQPSSGVASIAQSEINRLETFMLTHGLRASTTLEEAWAFFLQTRRAMLTLYGSKSLAEKLPMHERLQREIEAFLRAHPADATNTFLKNTLHASATTSALAEAVWLSFRLVDDANGEVGQLMAQRAVTLQATPSISPLDQILIRRIDVQLASSMQQRREKAAEFCEALKINGINEVSITKSAFIDHLQAPTPIAGCFSVTTGDDGIVEFSSTIPLRLSFNSFYALPNANVQLTAPSVELSMLDTSATRVHSTLPQLPTPADSDALTLPMVVGVLLENNEANGLSAGTHYMLVHMTVNKAKDGAADARVPAAGFDGGDVIVRANVAPSRYALISFATAGQKSPPVPEAGMGDRSDPSAADIAPFILGLPEHNSFSHPYRFHGGISVAKLRTLLDNGTNFAGQNVLALDVPTEYSSVMKVADADKLRAYCATAENPTPNAAAIGKCMSDNFLNKARQLMFDTVAAVEALVPFDPNTQMPAFSVFSAFILPAGAAGTVKPNGPDGQVGEAKFIAL